MFDKNSNNLTSATQGGNGIAPRSCASSPYKVMVVDDSVVIRGIITKTLEQDPGIEVVATAQNGKIALEKLDSFDVEVVVLDIEMPIMDGLTALPQMLSKKPEIQVVMASTLTTRNADISIRAMELGAADYIPKPTSSREALSSDEFKIELVEKVKALAESIRRHSRYSKIITESKVNSKLRNKNTQTNQTSTNHDSASTVGATTAEPSQQQRPSTAPSSAGSASISLRKMPLIKPEVIAIGSSTGGPNALFEMFKGLDKSINKPIFITQHMPPKFTTMLASRIKESCGWDVYEAEDGQLVENGKVYLAPGDYHMTVRDEGGKKYIALNQEPKRNFCRPAVDAMVESLNKVYRAKVLLIILTGMGEDGLKEAKKLADNGGCVFAQDERSSVVWGMPGAVAKAGICSAVDNIQNLQKKIYEYAK